MPETDAALTKRPERKGGIVVEDDMRAPFTLQDYVKVGADFCPGMNRPAGRGFIQERVSYKAYHRSHVSKVVGIAVTACTWWIVMSLDRQKGPLMIQSLH
ncbi:unnamed protein product [Cylindrotheca closterium]|uniref:Uncharacterized protein n=1 Tax=Cylindrotheca closterium TaxID=2856 RepID=A0AAD2FKA0_9STRA|nr:unnamed protein product [Cylindrotheca closterium]